MIRSYTSLATRYDRMHSRWLRHAGGEAQAALEASVITRLTTGDKVLDAGCGTGALARAISRQVGDLSLTVLDACPEMLALTGDLDATRVQGSLLDLPFEDDSFDHATAAWAIEATGDSARAVGELSRVVRPGGHVLVAFCATEPTDRMTARVLRKTVELRRTGQFLDATAVQAAFRAHGADRVVRHRCDGPVAVMDARCGARVPLALAA